MKKSFAKTGLGRTARQLNKEEARALYVCVFVPHLERVVHQMRCIIQEEGRLRWVVLSDDVKEPLSKVDLLIINVTVLPIVPRL